MSDLGHNSPPPPEQATEAIRDGGSVNRDTPIIAVTANAMKGDVDKVRLVVRERAAIR